MPGDRLHDTVDQYGLEPHIDFRTRVVSASWSSPDQRWTVEVRRGDSETTETLTCRFLWGCTGYYRSPSGRVVTQWPYSMSEFERRTSVPDPELYESAPL